MKVAVDSRGSVDPRGIGRYVRCLVDGLRATVPAGSDVVAFLQSFYKDDLR